MGVEAVKRAKMQEREADSWGRRKVIEGVEKLAFFLFLRD
jgi:hypothetical protein